MVCWYDPPRKSIIINTFHVLFIHREIENVCGGLDFIGHLQAVSVRSVAVLDRVQVFE